MTLGPSGGSFRLALTSRASPSRPLTRLELRLPLARGAHAVQATATGGALATDERGRSVGGGAGRWEVVEREAEGTPEGERQVLVWKVDQLCSTDRPAVLEGQYYACVWSALRLNFTRRTAAADEPSALRRAARPTRASPPS